MEWISIKDKMPLEDDYVLLLDIYGSMTVGSWYLEEPNVYEENYFTPYPVFIDTNATSLENIEYWMPLPALPNGDSNA